MLRSSHTRPLQRHAVASQTPGHVRLPSRLLPLLKTNKKVLGKFKDECCSVPPVHFVGLRSKMYSLLTLHDVEKVRAKGVKTQFVKKHLRHQDYVECLHNDTQTTAQYLAFRSRNHVITTDTVTKVALSSFDDKRYLLPNTPDTWSHGHWRIRHREHSATDVARITNCLECFAYWQTA